MWDISDESDIKKETNIILSVSFAFRKVYNRYQQTFDTFAGDALPGLYLQSLSGTFLSDEDQVMMVILLSMDLESNGLPDTVHQIQP